MALAASALLPPDVMMARPSLIALVKRFLSLASMGCLVVSRVGFCTVFLPQNVDDFHGNWGRYALHARDVLEQVKGDFCEMALSQIGSALLTNDVDDSILFGGGELVHRSPLVDEVKGPSLRICKRTTVKLMLTYTLECWKVLAAVTAEIQSGLELGEPNPLP